MAETKTGSRPALVFVLAALVALGVLVAAVSLGPIGWVIAAALVAGLVVYLVRQGETGGRTSLYLLGGLLSGGLLYLVLALIQGALGDPPSGGGSG